MSSGQASRASARYARWGAARPLVVVHLALASLGIGCGSSSAGAPDSAPPPDARGCSDWPSRPGTTFISLDGQSQFEVESFVLAAGNDPDADLYVAYEALGCDGLTRVGVTRRTPSGFEKPRYLESPDGQMASNVTLARDGAGTVFAAWAAWTPGPDPAQPHISPTDISIQLARWPAGAAAFEPPVEISEAIPDQLYDKPWLVITPDGGILVSYSDLRRGGIVVASSVDGGASFRRAQVDTQWANLASLCLDGRPGGAFITYYASRTIQLAHTADGGATWTAPFLTAVGDPTGDPACQDPTCASSGDEVWISYGRTHDSLDLPVARLASVRLAHAVLGAARVDDLAVLDTAAATAAGAPGFFLFPQLARQADGALAIAAYRAASEGTGTAELVRAVSRDGGRTFGDPVTLATGLSPSLQRHVPDWLGDYFGWTSTTAGIAAAYIDNRSGSSHIAFDERPLP